MRRPAKEIIEKAGKLDDFTIDYGTAVLALPFADYCAEFCRFYRIGKPKFGLVPSPDGFRGTLREVCGYSVWEPIAEKTEEIFGVPDRVTVPDDVRKPLDRLEMCGGGLGPFYCMFDIMFCEYDGFVLCFMSGSND